MHEQYVTFMLLPFPMNPEIVQFATFRVDLPAGASFVFPSNINGSICPGVSGPHCSIWHMLTTLVMPPLHCASIYH
jgi:hypothetical protein